MSKKIASKLEKLQGAEWDSDSEGEEAASFERNADFVELEETKAKATPAKTTKSSKEEGKPENTQRKPAVSGKPASKDKQSNVIYLGRIPHGFYEDQMRGFFQQFGTVTRLRISRNKRTGKSKHYAFVEFADAEVAAIVANTMNGYRLFDHVLSSHVLPVSDIHDRMFVGANKTFKPLPWRQIARNAHNAERTYEQTIARNKRLIKKDEQKRQALAALGIDYDFPGYKAQAPAKQQHIVFD